MRVADFDFQLPDDLIALRPAAPRDAARMLVVRPDAALEHGHVQDLTDYLDPGDAIVLNDTKVIRARLRAVRLGRGPGEPKIELLLIKRLGADAFRCLARPGRKLSPGDPLRVGGALQAVVTAKLSSGEIEVRFDLAGGELDAAIAREGEMPLPPYIAGKRTTDERDDSDYQTVFAACDGSVAAPTAGLHFTPDLLARARAHGIAIETVTLHVGAGTFLPVSADDTGAHRMHSEWAELSEGTAARLNAVRDAGKRILAVGTTSIRTLESAADDGRLRPFVGETDIFITPGYRFQSADMLLTNFHLPRSTLFMLVSAFCGLETMKDVYAAAIERRYRFYSYGDACLLFRRPS